ncbi:exosortase A [Sphingomonas sp. LY54]|uniref:exosortase A n=1 Tax=Sphingomonas sp. LY54 TaxID=3095343 RepID=UPI002D765C5F|nr:exosortase A [Sphingomonas sp. LY54]WRP28998.1 exosortase A [Sphingomonas sp. LY54]
MTAQAAIVRAAGRADPAWRPHLLALAGAAAGILVVFHRDAADMVRIWLNSSTYNHCALILPIIAWLVWQRRPALDRLAPAAWAPGLVLVAAGALLWLLGEAGGVALARHLGLVLMLQATVIACLGKSVARGLAFPLFYALFLVPAGDEIVPLMQTVTAELCMALLRLSGIPAHLEGIFITIPSGLFRVAEACAGVKFLVAMVALGALVANLCFRSWKRRALFMLAAVAIPILANGVRAWGTIYIAHVTDSDFAAGVDHVIYGWIFFAIVIALTLGVGWRFFDRAPGDPWFDPEALRSVPGKPQRAVQIAAAALAIAAVPPLWSAAVAAGSHAPSDIALPSVPGWQRVAGDLDWQPHFAGADRIRIGRYRDAMGREVDLAIAVFARQGEGREMVGFGQGAVGPEGEWTRIAATPPPSDGRSERIGSGGTVREVATFYRVGDLVTGSEYRVKLETMKTRLLGGPQRAVALLVSAPEPDARPAIDAFLHDLGPIAPVADRAAGA